jgi:Zn-dependent protease
MQNFFSWGLYVGQVAGIRIRIHGLLLIWWAVEFNNTVLAGPVEQRKVRSAIWALGALLVFLSILLHELGHCFAARRVGGDAHEILLWPLGGLAFCRCPDHWKSHLIVAAGGPLVTLAIVTVSYVGFGVIEPYTVEMTWFNLILVHQTATLLIFWNSIILIFNLIPLYPLDGGRIFHALAWGYFSRRGGQALNGYGRASRVTLWVSRATVVAGVICGLYLRNIMLVVIFVWAWSGAESLKGRRY